MKKTVWKNVWQTAVALALLVGAWLVVWAIVGNDSIFPPFSDSVKAFFTYFIDGGFWRALGSSFLRVLIAFLISFVLAGGLAFVSYLYPTFARIFAPVAAVIRVLPVFAIVFLLLTWTSASVTPVLVAFLSLFPMLYTAFFSAFSGVDKGLVEMSKAYKVPLKKRITQLYLPSVAPFVVKEVGAGLGFAVKLVVSAEVLVRTARSLGYLVLETQSGYTELPKLFALVIAVCLIGFLLECLGNVLAKAIERGLR
ncbi:MAG: ABC transporter permease subunit [Clostridia bacterium]|nr:ABC transporter permease subunit [Clostridia bacterium]